MGRARRCRRGGRVISAATEAAPRALRAVFERTRTREQRVIGSEYEALAIDPKTGLTIGYEAGPGIRHLLEHLRDEFGWEPIEEHGHLIALRRDGQSITLEPGGQFEMSGAPLRSLGETAAEVERHHEELRSIGDALGVEFRFFGLNPLQTLDNLQWMPKPRYGIMRRYLPTRGDRGLYMMGMTCTVQANLDYLDEADFSRKFRLATGVTALATALFANSPLLGGAPSGFQSYRAHIWTRVDPDRCGLHPYVFDTDMGFDDYINWARRVPMFFVQRDGHYVGIEGAGSFDDLRAGRIDGLREEPGDWELHMSTVFPDVRARPHIEVRGSDVVPPHMLVACPALWKGLLYDELAAESAWDLVKNLSFEQRLEMADTAARRALAGARPVGRGTLGDMCRDLVAIAREGLLRLAQDELGSPEDVRFLEPLEIIASTGRTLADRTLAGEDIHEPLI